MKKSIFHYPILLLLTIVFSSEGHTIENTINMLSDTDDGVAFEVSLPLFEFINIENSQFKKINADGFGVVKQGGAPGVIIRGVLIELPLECDIDVQVYPFDNIGFENFLLAPSPQRILVEGEQGEKRIAEQFKIDEKIYSTDAFFPGKLAEVEFTGYLRGRRVAKLNIFPVQYNPVTKELEIHKKIKINVTFNYHAKAKTYDSDVITSKKSHNKDNPFRKVYKSSLLNYKPDKPYKTVNQLKKSFSSFNTLAAEIKESPFAIKAVIEEEGIYKITHDYLNTLGIDLSTATNENLKMENQGQEVAIYCSGTGQFKSGDHIIFYGESFKSLYSKKNVYWLYQGKQSGKRMTEINGNPTSGYPVQTVFENTYYAEEDIVYWSNIPPFEEGYDHWFWTELNINAVEDPSEDGWDPLISRSHDLSVYLNNINRTSGNYSMRINLRGETDTGQDPDHHTKVYVNGNLIADFTWNGQIELTKEINDISASYFVSGDNTITVEAVDDTGATVDSYYLNWFKIEYWDTFVAEDNYLKFNINETGGVAFQVEGFTDSDLWAFDVTDSVNVNFITNAGITKSGSTNTINFDDDVSGSKTYFALSSGGFSTLYELAVDEPSDLSTERDSIDYIIITHENFYEGIQELKNYRESKELNVEVAKIQDIYDEFSYGIKDATAIKDFLTYAYNNWNKTDHPTYVLLVGDASVDYRDDFNNYAQGKEDLVPTYIFQTSLIGDTPTDNWFVCVDGSDYLPDMFIGRLCVKTEEDLQNIIDKIKKYEGEELSAWCGNVILAADDGSTFESISDSLAGMLPDGFNAKKVYVSEYEDTSSATDDLIDKINAGAVITNYTGHGHVSEWASPYLFHTPDFRDNERNDVEKLTNGDKLTFVIVMNCMSGYFPGWEVDYSLAEEFVRLEDKGAIACIAPTGAGYPSEHQVLAKNIFSGFFDDEDNIAGSLVTGAKIDTYLQINSRDIIETFVLFGDPATELKLVKDFGNFELLTPADNETLPKFPPSKFTWGKGLYERFKVQYSTDASFPPETTITVSLLPFIFNYSGQYKPNIFIWAILRVMSFQNEIVYWRVVAYDEDFNPITYSDYRSFSFEE